MIVVLAGCSVEGPDQSLPVQRPPLADEAEGKPETDSQTPSETTAANGAAENAGLRDDFNAP